MRGELWAQMDAQPRRSAASLMVKDVPKDFGVYTWYYDGEAVYSGRAMGRDGLHDRIWKRHLRTGRDLSRSSFRRNACDYLGIAPTSVTRQRPAQLTSANVEPVNAWIRRCEVSWITCDTPQATEKLESDLFAEWMPPLSRR